MRGGKDEEKLVSPMFPRLHVNDKEKGGPRAPPRNKMALYEQFSLPSPRFISSDKMPLRADNGGSLLPSTSSSHVGGRQSSMFSPLCNSPAHSCQAEKLRSYSLSGVKLNTTMGSHEQNSMKPTSHQSLNATGPLSSTVKSKTFQSNNSSIRGEDDCRFPTPAQGIDPHCSNRQCSRDREKLPHLSLSSSVKLQNASEKRISGTGTIDTSSREFVRKQAEEHSKVSQSHLDPVERSASIMSTRDKNTLSKKTKDKNLADTSSTSLTKVNKYESFKRGQRYSSQGDRSSLVEGTNAQLHQENVAVQERIVPINDSLVEPAKDIGKENASKLRRESCSRPSLGDDNSPIGLVNGSDCREDKRCGSVQVGDVDRHVDVLDTTVACSISALDISSDDVVGVIGVKQFWKARSAIVNQQRVFAVQVFELHRLIKVQRLIAGSPHLLLADNLYLGKPSLKVSLVKNLSSEYSPEPPSPLIVIAKDNSPKANPSIECAGENAVGKFALPSLNNDTSKELVSQQSNCAHYSGNPPPAPAANNTKPPPWCLHPPPGNQWLVPVMSPLEGFVYKPYTGPCPPTAGFMAPMYGNCSPMSLNPGNGNFLNTAYGVPVSHHEIGILQGAPLSQAYFPPYGLPVMNQSLSSSTVEQISPFPGARSNGQDSQLSTGDTNFTIPQQSSCKMSSQVSRVISCRVVKFPALNESESQGSGASSPSERAKGDELASFIMTPIVQASDQNVQTTETPTVQASDQNVQTTETPTVQASDQNVQTTEHRAQVIKVIPHNPRSATESAARIFLILQEERKQL